MSYSRKFFIFGLFFSTAHVVFAYNASDLLGQLNTGDVPNYTSANNNNDPSARGMSFPIGVALDPVHHHLFIGDVNNARVLVFNLDSSNHLIDRVADNVIGQPNMNTRVATTSQSGMQRPIGLEVDPNTNRLFVADDLSNRILVYDISTITDGMNASFVLGQSNFTASSSALTSTGFLRPIAMKVDQSTGKLYVDDYDGNRILVFSLSGGISNGMAAINVIGQSTFGTSIATTTQNGLQSPHSLFVDASSSRLFVSDINNNRVLIYNIASTTNGMNAVNVIGQSTFTSFATGTSATGLTGPVGLLYDPSHSRFFVSDHYNNRVLIYDTSSGFSNGMAAVNVLGQSSFTASTTFNTQSNINGPEELAYDFTNQLLYVPQNFGQRVQVFSMSSITNNMNAIDLLGQLDKNDAPAYTKTQSGGLPDAQGVNFPHQLALDKVNHRLFLADIAQNRILVFLLNVDNTINNHSAKYVIGQPNADTGLASSTASALNQPLAIGLNTSGNRLYVTDFSNNRVLVFDVSTSTMVDGMSAINVIGQQNFTSNSATTTRSGLNAPNGIAVDNVNNRLFVSDYGNNRVLQYDLSSLSNGMNAAHVLGQVNYTNGAASTSQTGLSSPYRPAYDAIHNRLFVPDILNNRVMIWDTSTITDGMPAVHVLGQSTFTTAVATTTQTGMNWPTVAEYDSKTDTLFVSEYNNSRVTSFDVSVITDGKPAMGVIGQANFTSIVTAATQSNFNLVTGLAYDPINKVMYVTDNNHHRIMMFKFITITTSTVSNGTVGQSYGQLIAGINNQGTPIYSIASGTLPAGLTLSSSGLISGIPTQAGNFTFSISAKDQDVSAGTFVSDISTFTINIAAGSSGSSSGGSYFLYLPNSNNVTSSDLPVTTSIQSYTIAPVSIEIPSRYIFNRNASLKMTGNEVMELQKYLNAHGYVLANAGPGSPGHETTMFGALTYYSLLKFQNAHKKEILVPLNLSSGTGILGTSTRNFLNNN